MGKEKLKNYLRWTFFEYSEADNSIQKFLEDSPTVSRKQAIEVLESF